MFYLLNWMDFWIYSERNVSSHFTTDDGCSEAEFRRFPLESSEAATFDPVKFGSLNVILEAENF